jgi:hypothetical protein
MTITRDLDDLGALGILAPVALDEVTAVADLQTRRDRKYVIHRSVLSDLLAESWPAARVLTIDGARSFRYESIYFDTPDLTSYHGAARRRPRRFKVRTRSYLDQGTCFVEVKVRDARGRTVKHRHPHDLDRRTQLTDAGRQFVTTVEHTANVVDQLQATLATAYRRATLVLADTHARVTIDVDVAWHQPDGRHADLPGVALVETKTAGPPCLFDRALWRHGHRPVTISKYCTGLAALRPYLPANKWNRVLRRHFDWLPPQAP